MKYLNWAEIKTETPDTHRVFVATTPIGEYRIIFTGAYRWWWVKYCNENSCEGEEHNCLTEDQAKALAQKDFTAIRDALCA